MLETILSTYKFRIKDSSCHKVLQQMARDVNFVWNVCNEQARKRWQLYRRYTNKSDLGATTKGASKFLSINQQSVQMVSYELERRLKTEKKAIRFRGKKSLGWIPIQGQSFKIKNDEIHYNKQVFRFWKSRELPNKPKMGSFNSDARGKWYVNLVVEVPKLTNLGGSVGIDLGLTTAATTSDGLKLVGRNFRKLETKLASAQRANKKKLARKIHDKIKNKRKDGIEKFTTTVARENSLIVVGDVSSKKIIRKTNRFAKSASDASWYQIKSRLLHKAIRHGGRYMEVNEAYTSKTCSDCGTRWEFPKGLKSLAIREYICPCCGVVQDRDINAARNILRIGHDSLIQEESTASSSDGGCHE